MTTVLMKKTFDLIGYSNDCEICRKIAIDHRHSLMYKPIVNKFYNFKQPFYMTTIL